MELGREQSMGAAGLKWVKGATYRIEIARAVSKCRGQSGRCAAPSPGCCRVLQCETRQTANLLEGLHAVAVEDGKARTARKDKIVCVGQGRDHIATERKVRH
jgi:hypothetical protein